MYYSAIRKYDVANGPGIRVSLFVSGCDHHCKGCFQPETWDPKFGKPFDEEAKKEIMECLSEPQVDGITLLGGDPLYKDNIPDIFILLSEIKKKFCDSKTVWLYTGYTFENILYKILMDPPDPLTHHMLNMIIKYTDILVDGKFEEKNKDLRLQYRGSSNQRLIDVKKSIDSIGSGFQIYYKNRIEDETYTLAIKESDRRW